MTALNPLNRVLWIGLSKLSSKSGQSIRVYKIPIVHHPSYSSTLGGSIMVILQRTPAQVAFSTQQP
jgi:hypothetical protein